MENEVDKLEIVVEAEASRANRAMSALEKKIDRVAESLERCMLVAQGAVSLKGVNIDKLFSGPAMEKSAKDLGKKVADDLIKSFNLNLSGKDVENQVENLTRKISKGLSANAGNPYKGFSDDIEELGRITAKNGQIAKSTSDEYQNLYSWIKKTGKIRISPETAKSLGDDYKQRTPLAQQKISTKSGIELDSIYQELREQFPTILKEAYSVEDEFYQMENALKEFYRTSNSFYKPEWMEQDAYESVISGVGEISAGIKEAKAESGNFEKSLKGIDDAGKSFSELFGANMDLSGLERAQGMFRDISRAGRTDNQKQSRSDLKFPKLPYAEINKKFRDSRLDTDFSSMDTKSLQDSIAKNENAYIRTKQAISNMISLEGTDELGGKEWYNKIMQMHQYENAVYDATETLGRLEAKRPEMTINRSGDAAEDVNKEIKAISDGSNEAGKSANAAFEKMQVSLKEVSTQAEKAHKEIAAIGDGTQKVEKQSLANGIKNAFRMDENGKLPNLKKLPGVFKDSAIGTAGRISDFLKMDDTGSIVGIEKIKAKISELRSLSKSSMQIDVPDTSGIDTTITRLQNEIERTKNLILELYMDPVSNADSIDEEIKSLSVMQRELKRYENLKDGMSPKKIVSDASAFKKLSNSIQGSANKVNKAKKSYDNVKNAIKNAKDMANKAIHPFRTLRELMSGDGGKRNNGMNLGRMIGSSILFSSIFGMISRIKQAVKEGSDNLVQYSSEYNKSISGLVSSLLYLKNAWAAAFAPIINVVGPYISKFIDMVAGALNAVGQFAAALTGKGYVVQAKKAWSNYADSLDTTKKSADDASKSIKDLQNYTLGIDELNIIQPSSNSGSSGSGSSGDSSGPSPSDMFETVEVSNSMNKLADMFKDAVKNSDFTDIGKMLGNKLSSAMESIPWNMVYHKADNFGKDLATFLNGLISPRLFFDLGSTIAGAINTALHSVNSFEINFDWKNFGNSLASSLKGFFTTWDAGLTGATFSHFVTGLLEGITGFLDGLQNDKVFEDIGQDLVDLICGIDWGKITWDLIGFARSFEKAIVNLPNDLLRGAMQKLADKLTGGKVEIKLPKFVLPPVSGLGLFAYGQDIITDILKGISGEETKIPESFGRIKTSIFKKFDDIGSWFGKKFGSARKTTESQFSNIGSWFSNRKTDIQNGMKDIEPWMLKKYTSARKDVNSAFQNVGSWFGQRKTDIQNNMSNINTWFATKYQNARSKVNSSFQNVGTWFGNRRNDIQNNMQNISTWFSNKFKSSRLLANAPFSNIGSWFGQRREDIKTNMRSISQWFKDIFKSAYNGITSIFDNVGDYFGKVAGWIKSPVLGAVKAIAKAVNWVYGKLGGDGDLIDISGLKNYANGTSGVAKDSFGIVNDQPGNMYRELVQFPNGKTVIPTGRNVVLPMPKGTKVMPAGQTAALMGMTGVKKYKSGIGNFFGNTIDKISSVANNVFQYIKDPEKLLEVAIDKFTDLTDAFEPGLSFAKSAVNSVFDTAVEKVKGFFDSFGAVDYKPSAGVEQWRGLAKQALMLTHQFSEANLNALLTQMMHESGGNPNAINNWDINAIRGIPSKGLMQVIDPTFHANAMAGYDTNIYDPLSNMIAAINYTVRRYGSLYNGWTARGYKGYKTGGMPINGEVYVANEEGFGSEYIGSIGNRHVVANNQQITNGISQGVERANDETNALLRQVIENQEKILKKDTSTRLDSKKVNKQLSRGSRNSGYSFSTV